MTDQPVHAAWSVSETACGLHPNDHATTTQDPRVTCDSCVGRLSDLAVADRPYVIDIETALWPYRMRVYGTVGAGVNLVFRDVTDQPCCMCLTTAEAWSLGGMLQKAAAATQPPRNLQVALAVGQEHGGWHSVEVAIAEPDDEDRIEELARCAAEELLEMPTDMVFLTMLGWDYLDKEKVDA